MMKTQILSFCTATVLAVVVLCAVATAQDNTSAEKESQAERYARFNADEQERHEIHLLYLRGEEHKARYFDGESRREAMRWFRKAAERGHREAQFQLGREYWSGRWVAVDKNEAVRWFREAAEQGIGHASAQIHLGRAYRDGEGVGADKHEALRWFRKALERGDMDAQYELGFAYWNGEGVAENKREAMRRWHEASNENPGNADQLGYAFWSGKGVAVDKHEARRWWQKAVDSDAGEYYAELLGNILWTGDGISEDKREAVHWYRKAAKQGVKSDGWVPFRLGVAYSFGFGVAVDKRKAVQWYRKAAAKGQTEAQYNLGVSYWNGEGVIADKREAYIWYSIAKANGDEDAAKNLRENNWHLTQSEVRSAQKEAARRLEEIDRRIAAKGNGAQKPAIEGSIALAPKPKDTNIAAHVFENAWRSVVVVRNGDGQGSGVIVRPNIVATNCHVVDGRDSITVYKSNNRRADTETAFSAAIRQSDEDKDFCLLDVAGLWGVPATVRKYGTLSVGEDVYGLGAPQGLDLSLSGGVISQLREVGGDRFIQTDAAISPGSSGGGLFDSEGNLIGILTAKIVDKAAEGIGFAIPADLVLGY